MANYDSTPRFSSLRGLSLSSPAFSNAEREDLIESEERAALIAEGKLMPESVRSTKAAPDFMNIEDTDTLYTTLNDNKDPLTTIQDKFRKLKEIGAARAAASMPVEKGSVAPPPATALDNTTETDKNNKKSLVKSYMPSEDEIVPNIPIEIDFGDNTMARNEDLKDAQERRDVAVLINQLGKAADVAGSGMSGTQARFGGIFDQNVKNAEGIVTDYQDQVKFEKEDPNSAVSKGYRELAKSLGFNIKGMASAADLERLMPQLANAYNQRQAQIARAQEAKEKRESRLDEAQIREANRKDLEKEKIELKDESKREKDIDEAKKALDKGTTQKLKNSFYTAKRMEMSIGEFAKNPNGYSDYATLMGGLKVLQGDDSVVRETEIKLGMRSGSLLDKIKNEFMQAWDGKSLQPSQRKNIINTIKVMSDSARELYLRETAPAVVSAKRRSIPLNELFDEELIKDVEDYYIKQQQIKAEREKAKEQSVVKEDPKISNYAKQHGLDYNKASSILKARGYSGQ
jgi:hypothetical protein